MNDSDKQTAAMLFAQESMSLIEKYRLAKRQTAQAYAFECKMLEEARKAPLPLRLRPAVADDIKRGALIWYKHGDDGPFWQIVDEVRNPNSAFKAYVAEDGSRYGLDDAFVEVKDGE